jgi:hypothetical protein
MRLIVILCAAAAFGGCHNIEGKLDDVSWGAPVKSDYQSMVERARTMTLRRFPKGLDPDKTNEEKGDFYTVWDYKVAVTYRDTTRSKAHVKVEDLGEGKVRVGAAVVKQINDNIDNPHDINEARWMATQRDEEAAALLVSSILVRHLEAEPSEYWKEKNRTEKRTTPREDLIDRSKDVDLDEQPDPRDTKSLDPITGGRDE